MGLDPTAATWDSRMEEGTKKAMPSFAIEIADGKFYLPNDPLQAHRKNAEFWDRARELKAAAVCIDGPCEARTDPDSKRTTRVGRPMVDREHGTPRSNSSGVAWGCTGPPSGPSLDSRVRTAGLPVRSGSSMMHPMSRRSRRIPMVHLRSSGEPSGSKEPRRRRRPTPGRRDTYRHPGEVPAWTDRGYGA